MEYVEFSYITGGKQMLQYLWKTVKQFLIKLNIHLTDDPASSTPRYLPKGNESIYPHKHLCMDIYSSFIHKCPKPETTPGRIKKKKKIRDSHTMEYHSSVKMSELLCVTT